MRPEEEQKLERAGFLYSVCASGTPYWYMPKLEEVASVWKDRSWWKIVGLTCDDEGMPIRIPKEPTIARPTRSLDACIVMYKLIVSSHLT